MNMEKRKSKFMERVEKLKGSENSGKIGNISMVNEGEEKLDGNVERFNEGLKIYGEWLGKTYGNKKTK